MTDPDFLALIAQGPSGWNRWRTDHPEVQPDLSGTYLFGQALNGFDFSGANLDRACLIGTSLRGANLSKASLQGAYASSADFSKADLSGADLSQGNFSDANFSEATLCAIQVKGTNLADACLEGAYLSHWQIDSTTALSGLRGRYVYTGEKGKGQQRQPQRGAFQPEDLSALVRQLPGGETAAIASHRELPRLPAGLGAASVIAVASLIFVLRSNGTVFTANDSALPVSVRELSAGVTCEEGDLPPLPPGSTRYKYDDEAIYYGKLVDGQPADGRGIMVYASGNRYDGEYVQGQRSGCGKFTFINGRSYTGQFEADQFSGQGTWVLENGDRYIGQFKDNLCNGQGTFVFADGSSKSGVWEAGKLANDTLSCGQGSVTLPPSSDG